MDEVNKLKAQIRDMGQEMIFLRKRLKEVSNGDKDRLINLFHESASESLWTKRSEVSGVYYLTTTGKVCVIVRGREHNIPGSKVDAEVIARRLNGEDI